MKDVRVKYDLMNDLGASTYVLCPGLQSWGGRVERVQKGISHWDKQNNDVPAPNCVLKVWGEVIKVEGL